MQKDNLPELLSPKVDIIFKLLFGDERNKDLGRGGSYSVLKPVKSIFPVQRFGGDTSSQSEKII